MGTYVRKSVTFVGSVVDVRCFEYQASRNVPQAANAKVRVCTVVNLAQHKIESEYGGEDFVSSNTLESDRV